MLRIPPLILSEHGRRRRPRAVEGPAPGFAALVGHGDSFLDELDSVFEVIRSMPLRFPIAYGQVHRALLRRYPFAAFFRIRPNAEHVVVLAVFPQHGDPARWPKR